MTPPKYRLGYIPGSFDLFHVGHLNILKRAKDYCEKLIVGVSTDELVCASKHKTPIIPFEERIEIVRAIRYVDLAVKQENHNKFEMWEKHHFGAIFGGDDLKGTERWNELERRFQEVGVDVVYFPYTEETSSTVIREALNRLRGSMRE